MKSEMHDDAPVYHHAIRYEGDVLLTFTIGDGDDHDHLELRGDDRDFLALVDDILVALRGH